MRRRRRPLEISTFPFLAVLLCAMGSLILVLIVMDRKAKLGARYKVLAAQAQAAEELAKIDAARREQRQQREAEARAAWEQKRDDLHTTLVDRQQALQAQIKKIQEQLADAAGRLKAELDDTDATRKHVESQRTRLAGEQQALASARHAIEKEETASAAGRAAKAKMTADLVQLEAAVKNLKEARERDKQTYSVVPYHGKHGESRRPLYIECTRDGVIFHPDRVVVAVGLNPGAARAEVERRIARQREYLASIQAKADDKPYLMLLVRPDSITTYYEIQSALRALDLEFGYEFVDAAWVFDFSKDDSAPAPVAGIGPPTKIAPPPGGAAVHAGGPLLAVAPGSATTGPGNRPDDGSGTGRAGAAFTSGAGGDEVGHSARGAGSGGSAIGPPPGLPPAAQGSAAGPHVGPFGGSGNSVVARNPNGDDGPGSPSGGPPGSGGSAPSVAPTMLPSAVPGAGPSVPPVLRDPPFRLASTRTDFATAGNHAVPVGGSGTSPGGDSGASGMAVPPGTNQPGVAAGPALAPGVTGARNPASAPPMGAAASASPTAPPAQAPTGSGRAGNGGANPGNGVPDGERAATPQFAPPMTNPSPKKQRPPLRVARLDGDRDYLIFIECRPDDVVLYPSRQTFTVQQLARDDQTLLLAVQKMIERRQSLVRPGEIPFRPQVRFLVHPESIRSYHTTYPLLSGLGVPQTRQNLDADDDVAAIVTGQ